MGYMRGDYYTGDYYAGDPGLGSFFKKAIGFVAHAIPGVSQAYDIASTAFGSLKGIVGKASSGGNPSNLPVLHHARMGLQPPPDVGIDTGLPTTMGGEPALIPTFTDTRPPAGRRTHLNKSTYVTRGGGTSRWPRGIQVHAKATLLVPNRRMNVANPRALRRSLRRVAGFAKLTKRVRRAVSMAASAVGVRHHRAKAIRRR